MTTLVTIVKQSRIDYLGGIAQERKGLPRSNDKDTLYISVHEGIADEDLDDWIRGLEYDSDFLYYTHRGDVSKSSSTDITNKFGAYAWIDYYTIGGEWQFAEDWYD